jgi:putative SOS response-associated peptidase YedK
MCGRYTLRASPEEVAEYFGVSEAPLTPRFNIAPTQEVPAVMDSEEGRKLVMLRWGLIPSWAKEKSIGAKLINARAETVAEKPSFRSAFKHRRCLLVTDGYFEWKKEGARKQPYYITLKEGGLFAYAGLWEKWKTEEGEILSCTIVTTEANQLMQPIHDRMPAILDPKDYAEWLDPTPRPKEALLALIRTYPHEAMRAYPVSTLVNNARNNSPNCVERMDEGRS